MRKSIFKTIPFIVFIILFAIPFFWLKPGFVDLGGDAGRLYYIDALSVFHHIHNQQTVGGVSTYAILPYLIFMFLKQKLVVSPTLIIDFDHGLQLSLSFVSIYFVIKELLYISKQSRNKFIEWIAIFSGIIYVGFITKAGWVTSTETQNQFFLNPLIFYFLLRFLRTLQGRYAVYILGLTLLYSYSFGFSSSPQLAAFYPFAFLFLYVYFLIILHKAFPWKSFVLLGISFVLLHAFHLIPMVASIFTKNNSLNTSIFSRASNEHNGLFYFDANRQTLGKLSEELFQPIQWNGRTILSLIIPIVAFLGFFRARSKLLALIGVFFAITFFLVSANITLLGVKIYRQLFYIPGFTMFRSFNDKWYAVYIFFYTLLFAVSLDVLVEKRRRLIVGVIGFLITISILLRVGPFLQGDFYQTTLYQSKNVPVIFELDPNVIDAISRVKQIPDDGKFLTLPFTQSVYQVIYGKQKGAYVGISMVQFIGDKEDFSGLWSFGSHRDTLVNVLKDVNAHQIIQFLSILNIRYIFRNTDPRIMSDFPHYPYPNYPQDTTVDLPILKNQRTYDQLLGSLPLAMQYKKGFFEIMKLNDSVVRPTVYIPDIVYASESGLLEGSSFHSAYLDKQVCDETLLCDGKNDGPRPQFSFTRLSSWEYRVSLRVDKGVPKFLIVFSEDYDPSWKLSLESAKGIQHVLVNGYANGWIIDPSTLNSGFLTGTIYQGFHSYFVIGQFVSIGAFFILIGFLGWNISKKRYEKK